MRNVRRQIAVATERDGEDQRPRDGTGSANAQEEGLLSGERGFQPRAPVNRRFPADHAQAPVTIT